MYNNQDDLIHVKSYIKNDGTLVKEHWRGEGSQATSNLTLEGGVEITDSTQGGIWGAVAGVVTSAAKIAVTVLPVALQIYQASRVGNQATVQQMKPKLFSEIQLMKQNQLELKNNINFAKSIIEKNKNDANHWKLLESYNRQNNLYQRNAQSINVIEQSVQANNYQAVIEELKNYQSNQQEVIEKNQHQRPLKPRINERIQYIKENPRYNPPKNIKESFLNALDKDPVYQQKGVEDGMNFRNVMRNGKIHDAKEMWKAASHDFKQSGKYIDLNANLIYSVVELPSKEFFEIVSQKIKSLLGTDDCLGIIFSSDSNLSKEIANSTEFKEHIQKNIDKLRQGEVIVQSSTQFKNNENLVLTLGKVDILYTLIDPKTGDLHALVLDVYDFDPNTSDWRVQQAAGAQEADLIRNYYSINIICITKTELEKLLNIRFK